MGDLLPETVLTTWQLLFSALWSTRPPCSLNPMPLPLVTEGKAWGCGKAVSPESMTECVSSRISPVGGSVTLAETPLKLLATSENHL